MDALLKRIPQLMIAEAAFRCGAYARALKCVEQHVREAPAEQEKQVLERVASFLQKICGGLDDSDGLEGLAKLRRSQTPREQILDLEHRGQWAYALDWYDAALRNDGRSADLRLGQLRCMLQLGHFETMLAVVRGKRSLRSGGGAGGRRSYSGNASDDEGGVGSGSPVSGSLQLLESSSEVLAVSAVGGAPSAKRSRRESLGLAQQLPQQPHQPHQQQQQQQQQQAGGASGVDQHSGVAGGVGAPASATDQFLSFGMQAAWRLSNWPDVEALLERNLPLDDFQCNVGRCLYHLVQRDQGQFVAQLQRARVEVMGPLLAASQDSYPRSFPHLLSLHLLSELETMGLDVLEGRAALSQAQQQQQQQPFAAEASTARQLWSARVRMTPPSFKVRQVLLHSRRVVAQIHAGPSARHWVEISRAARVDGQLEAARSALVQALAVDPTHLPALIERAQLLWAQGKLPQAVQEIEQVVSASASAALAAEATFEQRKERAKPELLLGRWLHQTGQKTFLGIRTQFEKVTQACPEWESGHFYLASYLDGIVKSIEQEYSADSMHAKTVLRDSLKFLPEIIASYRKVKARAAPLCDGSRAAQGLQHGHKHIHQALPRMLTVYFRYSRELMADAAVQGGGGGGKRDDTVKQIESKLTDEMKLALKNVPPYVWLSALPQIISRVCHDNPLVKQTLR